MTTSLRMFTPNQLDRRSVLKGVTLGAGAVVLQPFLKRLAAEARGEAPSPRIIFVFEANGLLRRHIQPKGVETPRGGITSVVHRPLSELEIPEPIAPLTPFKNRMTILLGLSCKNAAPNHGAGYGALGCYNAERDPNSTRSTPFAQTVDHALAGY